MRDLSGMDSISVPDGWRTTAFFERLVTEGICSRHELETPSTTAKRLFQWFRYLDFRDYRELKAMEKARKANGN